MLRHSMRDGPQGFRDDLPPRGHGQASLHPLEEDIVAQDMDIRRLLAENQHLADGNIARNRELGVLKEELNALSQTIPKIRADKETMAREHIQKCLKLEAELRTLEPLKAELVHLKSEAKELDAQCQELSSKAQGMSQDLKLLQAENQQIPTLKADLDALREEVMLARTACEYERKVHSSFLEQRTQMENNLVTMARDIEKLRAEHRSMEQRLGSSGVGGYGKLLSSAGDAGYFSSLGDAYNSEKGKGLYSTGASYDFLRR